MIAVLGIVFFAISLILFIISLIPSYKNTYHLLIFLRIFSFIFSFSGMSLMNLSTSLSVPAIYVINETMFVFILMIIGLTLIDVVLMLNRIGDRRYNPKVKPRDAIFIGNEAYVRKEYEERE